MSVARRSTTPRDWSKRGFTLTELLTVLAIVALLAALLLGAILGASRKAKNIQCASNLKQLGLGVSVFVSDFHVYPLAGNPGFSKGLYPEHKTSWISAVEKNGPSRLLQLAFVERDENAVSSLLKGSPARGKRILCGIALNQRPAAARLDGPRSWYFPGVPSLTIANHTGLQFAPAQPKYYSCRPPHACAAARPDLPPPKGFRHELAQESQRCRSVCLS